MKPIYRYNWIYNHKFHVHLHPENYTTVMFFLFLQSVEPPAFLVPTFKICSRNPSWRVAKVEFWIWGWRPCRTLFGPRCKSKTVNCDPAHPNEPKAAHIHKCHQFSQNRDLLRTHTRTNFVGVYHCGKQSSTSEDANSKTTSSLRPLKKHGINYALDIKYHNKESFPSLNKHGPKYLAGYHLGLSRPMYIWVTKSFEPFSLSPLENEAKPFAQFSSQSTAFSASSRVLFNAFTQTGFILPKTRGLVSDNGAKSLRYDNSHHPFYLFSDFDLLLI